MGVLTLQYGVDDPVVLEIDDEFLVMPLRDGGVADGVVSPLRGAVPGFDPCLRHSAGWPAGFIVGKRTGALLGTAHLQLFGRNTDGKKTACKEQTANEK